MDEAGGAKRQVNKNTPKQATSSMSLRRQAFMLFDMGMRPTDAAHIIGMNRLTAYRYFQQWKRRPRFLEPTYEVARRYFRRLTPGDRRVLAKALALQLGASEDEISAQMRKPWAVKQIVAGEWRRWPVESTGGKNILAKAYLRLLLATHSEEVRSILEMATDQGTDSLKDQLNLRRGGSGQGEC